MVNEAVEILIKQLPDYFKPIIEYKAIMLAHGYVLDSLNSNAEKIYLNNYIATCDEETLFFWEQLLGIKYKFGDTLDFRRARVLQKFNTVVPFSIGFLNDKLTELFGDEYELSVDPIACTISVKVTSDRYGAVDLLYDLLWDILPAHLQVIANQETTNNIGSRLSTAGFMAITFEQTIYHDNVYGIKSDAFTLGSIANTVIQTI